MARVDNGPWVRLVGYRHRGAMGWVPPGGRPVPANVSGPFAPSKVAEDALAPSVLIDDRKAGCLHGAEEERTAQQRHEFEDPWREGGVDGFLDDQ